MCYSLCFFPVIFIIAPYSFLASHEFHEVLIYFIIPSALVAFILGCRKHGDKLVALMGTGILLLIIALSISCILHAEQHSEEFIGIIITVSGSVLLVILSFEKQKVMYERRLYLSHN